MQIHGPAHVHGPHQVNAPHQTQTSRPPQSISDVQTVDQLDISEAGQALSKAHDVSEIRHERVAELRAKIADGSYETGERLEQAVERLLDEIV